MFYNACGDGNIARAVLSGCYKFGIAVLLRKNSATMTSVIEVYDDEQQQGN